MPYSFEQNCLKRFTWWVFIVTTVKLKKQAPGLIFSKALFEGLNFGGAYLWREICVSKLIGLALQFEGNFYRFCFVLLCIWGQFSKYKPPGGLYLKGQFNGGFFSLRVWGAYIWRGVYMKGLIFGILPYSDLIHPHTQDIQYSRRIQDFILILNHKACFPFFIQSNPRRLRVYTNKISSREAQVYAIMRLFYPQGTHKICMKDFEIAIYCNSF